MVSEIFSNAMIYLSSGAELLGYWAKFSAQAPGGGGDQYQGAVSNAIAAYLQTKGMIDQAAILSQFKTQLQTIAALFWLYSISMGIGAVAIFGSYRQGMYLLVGPALFFFMTETKIQTTGTELRFGDHIVPVAKEEQSQMLRFIRAINADTGETREISRFFGAYDYLVSEIVHDVVAMLINTTNKDHLRYMARERMLHFVLNSRADHGGFIRLISAVHYGECGHLMAAQQASAPVGLKPPVQHTTYQSQKEQIENYKKLWKGGGMPLDSESKGFVLAMKKNGVKGFENVPITNIEDPLIVNCETIWGYVAAAAKNLAERRLQVRTFFGQFLGGDTSQTPWNKVLDDLVKMLATANNAAGSDRQRAVDRLAAQIYRNSIESFSPAQLTAQAFTRTPFNAQENEIINGVLYNAEGHGGFMAVKFFAGTIPHVQAVLIYLLSIAFPFFAVFLVVPSRASSFLAWMGMWAWVKSWDIGFAIVHVAREILWKMMSTGINQHQQPVNWDDPMSIVSVAYNNDPFNSMNTYWMFISGLTLAVPFITAHFCLGATGLFDMFSGTIDQAAERFGMNERSISRRGIADVAEHAVRTQQARIYNAYAQRAMSQEIVDNDKQRRESAEKNFDEGATTNSGRPLAHSSSMPGGQIGTSLAQMHHGVAAFHMANIAGVLGDEQFIAQLEIARGDAVRNNKTHFMRGLPAFSAPVAPARVDGNGKPMIDPNTGNQQYDLSALEDIFGSREVAEDMASRGVTWGQLFSAAGRQQLDLQNLVVGSTGRRMNKWNVESEGAANSLVAMRSRQDLLMRPVTGGVDGVKYLPDTPRVVAEWLIGLSGRDLGKSSIEDKDWSK